MLVNELHQGGIRAVLAWDPTVFENMVLPADLTLPAVVDHIIYKYGDTPLFTPDPKILKYYIGVWSARRLPLWERYLKAIMEEYNPLENYDRKEDVTTTRNNTLTKSGTITDAHTGTTTDTHTGTVTTEHDGTVTMKRAADNSSGWENYDQQTPDTTDEATNDLTDETTHDDTIERTHDTTDEEDGEETIKGRIHGNIGVTTSQQMLTAELDLIPRLDIIDYIATDWHSEFCLGLY